jgi:hypothetical protein
LNLFSSIYFGDGGARPFAGRGTLVPARPWQPP